MKSNIKNLTSFKLESTAPNMSQHVATRWPIESSTQQCCDMLRWHVTIVWPGLKTRKFRLRSFGVIQIRISDPRSVWIMVHQRNRRIHSGHGFTGSFDVPWSRQNKDHWSGSGSPLRNAALVDKIAQILITIIFHKMLKTGFFKLLRLVLHF